MPNNIKVCSFDGCGRKHSGKGLCDGHLQQVRRGAGLTPLGKRSKTVGMTVRERFDYSTAWAGGCLVWGGPLNIGGYGYLKIRGKNHMAHRFAFEWENGPIGESAQIDHVCYNRACVNVGHLRLVSHKQNQENRVGAQTRNQNGHRGVSFTKKTSKWRAGVTHNNKSYHVGYFDDAHEAGAAAKAKRMELHTHSDGR